MMRSTHQRPARFETSPAGSRCPSGRASPEQQCERRANADDLEHAATIPPAIAEAG
jgi:hypothetical protein